MLGSFVCLVSAAWSHGADDSRAGSLAEVIEAGDVHELCLLLGLDQSLDYTFTATQPLAFNIHYHTGNEVFYPVAERQSAAGEAIFVAESEQEYCLMWTNRTAGQVTLSAEYAVAHH
jgi:hypothetical protein